MKEITVKVRFDKRYSIASVNQEISCKLVDFVTYYGFEITTDACKQFFESEEDAKRRLNEGERFVDW